MGWGGRWEGGSGWGTHVNPWLIHVNVWQKLLQYCKVISLQLIKINGKKSINTVHVFIYLVLFLMYVINILQHTVGYSPWGHKESDTTEQ